MLGWKAQVKMADKPNETNWKDKSKDAGKKKGDLKYAKIGSSNTVKKELSKITKENSTKNKEGNAQGHT